MQISVYISPLVPSTTYVGGGVVVGVAVGPLSALRYRMPSEASEIDFFSRLCDSLCRAKRAKSIFFGSALLIYALMRVQESPLLFDYVKLYLMNQVVVMLGTFHYLTVVVIWWFF